MPFDHASHLMTLTNFELLALPGAVQTELKRRGIARTAAVVGDVGEYIALLMYGGSLVPAGTRALDLIDMEGRRIQVKTRLANRREGSLRVTLKSEAGFDACLVLLLDPASLKPLIAREVSRESIVVMKEAKQSLHFSDFRTVGTDVLSHALVAWRSIGSDA